MCSNCSSYTANIRYSLSYPLRNNMTHTENLISLLCKKYCFFDMHEPIEIKCIDAKFPEDAYSLLVCERCQKYFKFDSWEALYELEIDFKNRTGHII